MKSVKSQIILSVFALAVSAVTLFLLRSQIDFEKQQMSVLSSAAQTSTTQDQGEKPLPVKAFEEEIKRGKIKVIGQPTKEYYPLDTTPRCVWDMEIFDNKLYIGSGDYDKNAGPVPMLCMSLADVGNWEMMGYLSDEQIGRFRLIEGKLTAPGWDPCASSATGNYYQLDGGEWKTHKGILDNLHNFDLAEFDGRLFAAIGAKLGKTPIIASSGDDKFDRIPMYKNGKPIDTSTGEVIRSQNLYALGRKLYADYYHYNPSDADSLTFELYRYENGRFIFYTDLLEKLDVSSGGERYKMSVMEKEVLDDRMFLTTGRLYYTDDMKEFRQITFPNDEKRFARKADLYKANGVLYILSYTVDENFEHEISIHSITDGKNPTAKPEYSFRSAVKPTAFAVTEDCFFVALGNSSVKCDQNGTVLQIDRKK